MHRMTPADLAKRVALRRMKVFATGLLVAVTVLFFAFRWVEETHEWAGFPRAFFEAAMVGALADWFAVTALFRYPLGLPIPHTAIIPRRKDQIGRSLGEFVQNNFLTQEVLHERLAGAHIGARFGQWLADEGNARRAGEGVADALRGTLEVLDDRDVSHALETLVERRVRDVQVAPLVGRAIDLAVEGQHHQRLLDAVLVGLRGFLEDNRATFRQRLESESPWWVPETIDDRIFDKIYRGVNSFVEDVEGHPEHELRIALDARLVAFAKRLAVDPELAAKGEELKVELLAHPDFRAWLGSLWGELKRATLDATANPDGELRRRIDGSLQSVGLRLSADPELQAKVDDWVLRVVGYVVEHYRGEVAELIASTVERWDAQSTSERMELQVGRDLQFIRINGTIVGGLAGLLIFSVTRVLF
jgi:uncharacterized membrane-anchored protein YjiN (DUF445 family)